jgi:hypothetical protein
MNAQFRILTPAALAAACLLAACGGPGSMSRPAPTTAQAQPAALTPSAAASEPYSVAIDPANFVQDINNPYFPLKPGSTYIYEGQTEKGSEHVEAVVTSDTKVIMGVTCIAVNDTVTVDGKLEEGTVDWYAQDSLGNVWYFGEDTKEYKDGKISSTHGAWLAGVDGAQPGIIMQANPAVGETYRQEYYKGEAEDMASVLSLTETASTPTGSYTNVLMTNEWSAIASPVVYEHKYYAKGVGNVLTKGLSGGWELKLIEFRAP